MCTCSISVIQFSTKPLQRLYEENGCIHGNMWITWHKSTIDQVERFIMSTVVSHMTTEACYIEPNCFERLQIISLCPSVIFRMDQECLLYQIMGAQSIDCVASMGMMWTLGQSFALGNPHGTAS